MTMFNDVVRLLTPQVGGAFPSGLSKKGMRMFEKGGEWRGIFASNWRVDCGLDGLKIG